MERRRTDWPMLVGAQESAVGVGVLLRQLSGKWYAISIHCWRAAGFIPAVRLTQRAAPTVIEWAQLVRALVPTPC